MGRRNAPHLQPPVALRTGELASGASLFGLVLSVAGGIYLAVAVNLLSAALAVSTLLSYLLVYTPLKRKTASLHHAGRVPGAMPTLIGWAGASGAIDWSRLGIVRGIVSLAVSALPGDRFDVPRRLLARRIPHAAQLRRGFSLHHRGNRLLHCRVDGHDHASMDGKRFPSHMP